jgi:hypothetical protein
MPLWLFWLPDEPLPLVALLVPLAVEPLALSAPIEPTPADDEPDDEPALLVPPTAPVLDAVAPPVLEPVELVWSLPWFCWLLLFRLPELPELPWLPALLPFASLDF